MRRNTTKLLAIILALCAFLFVLMLVVATVFDRLQPRSTIQVQEPLIDVGSMGGTLEFEKQQATSPVIGLRFLFSRELTLERLQYLLPRFPELRIINFSVSNLTDEMLKAVHGRDKLEELYLSNTSISDTGTKHLRELTGLRELSLDGTGVTDAALEDVGGLTELRGLYLSNIAVTDAGLKRLHGLSKLERLYLSETQVTDAGVAELKQAIPGVKVYR